MIGRLNVLTGKIKMPSMVDSIQISALLVHEKVHQKQWQKEGRLKYIWNYRYNKWKYERPAYLAQFKYLIEKGYQLSRHECIRDILDYGQSQNDVEELINEIFC